MPVSGSMPHSTRRQNIVTTAQFLECPAAAVLGQLNSPFLRARSSGHNPGAPSYRRAAASGLVLTPFAVSQVPAVKGPRRHALSCPQSDACEPIHVEQRSMAKTAPRQTSPTSLGRGAREGVTVRSSTQAWSGKGLMGGGGHQRAELSTTARKKTALSRTLGHGTIWPDHRRP